MNGIKIGDEWDSESAAAWRMGGRCVVVAPNDSTESPESWVMRRLRDGKTMYMHRAARLRGEWRRVGVWRRLRSWLRDHGLVCLGFAQEDFRHHHQLLYVWGPFEHSRWEVWRWPVGTGSSDVDDALKPLPFGSSEAYHRIGFMAERVHIGRDYWAAKRAMSGGV